MMVGVGALLMPWLVYRAMCFRAWNSSYRGLRFSFHSRYGEALKVYVGYGLLTLVTLGLCLPVWQREMHKFVINNLRYGHGRFNCAVRATDIFFILFKAFLVFAGAVAWMVVLAAAAKAHPVWAVIAGLFGLFAYISVMPYVHMAITNAVWNSVEFEGNSFSSEMGLKPYLGIVFSNWFFTLVTVGLYWPWAKVRLVRYRAECTALMMTGSLDSFVAAAAEHRSAFGDAALDVFDFDISL